MVKNRNTGRKSEVLDRSQVKQMVRGAISQVQELKRYDFAVATDDDFAVAGAVYGITTPIIQGDEMIQRSGEVVVLKKVRMAITMSQEAANYAYCGARFLMVLDTMNNGAVPAVTDVLTASTMISGYNVLNMQKNRFKIYYDQVFDLVGQTHMSRHTLERQFDINRKIFYNGPTNVAGANGKNALFMIAIGTAASANVYEYSFFHTLVFTDS